MAPLLIGHRGAAAFAPENSLASMREAIRRGADMVEFDVRLSGDGRPVVFHDAYLERLTNGQGAVSDHTAESLAALSIAGGAEGIPSLEAVLGLFARTSLRLYIELKEAAALAPTLAAIAAQDLGARSLLAAFDHAVLAEAARLAPGVARVAILEGAPLHLERVLADCRATHVALGLAALGPRPLAEAHARQCPVYVWTVDDPREMRRCVALGVDGIVTNRPDRAAFDDLFAGRW